MSFMDALKDLIAKEEGSQGGVALHEDQAPEPPRDPEPTEREKNLERIKELDKEHRDPLPPTKAPENERGDVEDTPAEAPAEEVDATNPGKVPEPVEVPINPDLADMVLANNLTPGAMKALTADKLAELKGLSQADFFQAVTQLNKENPAPSGRIEEAGAPAKPEEEPDWTLAFFE